MPGDLQITPEDVLKVWRATLELIGSGAKRYLVKGMRTERHDSLQTVLPSYVYTAPPTPCSACVYATSTVCQAV